MLSLSPANESAGPDWQPMDKYITREGLVRYELMLEEGPGALAHNVRVAQEYSGLDGFEKRTLRDLAFYCNAYNMLAMYLIYERLKKKNGRWNGGGNFAGFGGMMVERDRGAISVTPPFSDPWARWPWDTTVPTYSLMRSRNQGRVLIGRVFGREDQSSSGRIQGITHGAKPIRYVNARANRVWGEIIDSPPDSLGELLQRL